jgi:DNA polymerase-3 subunit delta
MKLRYADYAKSKEATCLGRWCLLFGPEQHLKREALRRMREEARAASPGGGEPSWEVVEGPAVTAGDLLGRSQMGSLFAGARVIVVQEADRIAGDQQEAMAKAVGPLSGETAVVLVTGEGSEGDRRRGGVRARLQRAIEEQGLAIEVSALRAREAAAWAIARAKALGKKLEPAAARKLADQKVGTGLGELAAEVEKLALFVGEVDIIASSHVDEVTPRLIEEDVFRLVDAVGRGNAGRGVAILRGLLRERRENPGRILGRLAQAIRLVWQAKLLLERGWRPGREAEEEAASMLPQDERKNALAQFARWPWLVQRTVRQANAFSWAQLAGAVEALLACDLAIKGIEGKVGDKEAALELLVVQLCTGVEMPVWRTSGGRRATG